MARLSPSASLPAFRQALLTRGRALTVEDIRAVCRATAPESIERVDIQKGCAVSPDPRQGLIRTLDIHVTLRSTARLTAEEQRQLTHELTITLQDQWTGLLPLRVLLTNPAFA
jgi:hypothetical protein